MPLVLTDSPLNSNVSLVCQDDNELPFAGRRLYLESFWTMLKLKLPAVWRSRSVIANDYTYLNIEFSDLLGAAIKAHISEFDEVVTYIRAAERVINKFDLRALLVADDQSIAGQAVVRTCHQYQIPTMMIQHGLIANPLVTMPIVSKYAVLGQQTKDLLVNRGMLPEKIVVTGLPRNNGQGKKNTCLTNFEGILDSNYDPAKPTVTVIAGPIADRSFFVMRSIEVANNLQVNVILKAHPTEDIGYYKQKITELGYDGPISIIKDVGIDSVLAITNILISYDSTVVMEAMVRQIPVVLLNIKVNYNVVRKPYYAQHLQLVRNDEPISSLVSQLLFDYPKREEHIQQQNVLARYLIKDNERAIDLIVDTVNELVTQV